MEDLLANISNIGFPIAISCYLLVRLEKKMEELKEVIVELRKAVEEIGKWCYWFYNFKFFRFWICKILFDFYFKLDFLN